MHDNNLSTWSSSGGAKAGADFDAVFPTVLKCFTIIAGGYLARRINLIGSDDLKGIRILIVYFLMPTMIAQAILAVHWEKVNWRFIACVFVAKAVVFVAVAAVTLALSNDLAKAGIYGIFATQSNDMALGCPLIKALYSSTHPEYMDYIYLVLPISLVLINPFGFLMMEIEAQRRLVSLERQQSSAPVLGRCVLLKRIVFGIATNPMIISTVIGVIGSLSLGHHRVPNIVNVVLDGFSSGFITVALFALGCTLMSGGKPDAHYPLGTALILSLAKILLLPLVLRELISLTNIGRSESDGSGLAIFGFLYGSLPTAPTVFVFACQYNVAVKQVSTGLALVTLISAPWVYLSSKMISISHIDQAEYNLVFTMTEFNTAIVGIVSAGLCLIVFVITSKIRRVPHVVVFYLLVSSLIACTGVLIGEGVQGQEQYVWVRRVSRTFTLWGELSLRVFTVCLALFLTILRTTGLCMVLRVRALAALLGFCVPLFIALSVVLSAEIVQNGGVSTSEFDTISAYITAVVVSFCLVANVVLLVCQYKCGRVSAGCVHQSTTTPARTITAPSNSNADLVSRRRGVDAAYDNPIPDIEDGIGNDGNQACDGCEAGDGGSGDARPDAVSDLRLLDTEDTAGPSTSREDIRPMCPPSAPCTSDQRFKCKRQLRQYMKRTRPMTARSLSLCEPTEAILEEAEVEWGNVECGMDVYEITKHSFLVAFLCISMTVSVFVALWQSVQKELENGTFLQLRLLDTVFLYGQPVVALILFGLDDSWLSALRRRLRRMCYGSEKLILPSLSEIDGSTKAVCEQFSRYHMTQCANEIAKTVRNTLSVQENVFRGVDLVDYLIGNGISDGRASAVKYGRRLVLGRVIEHTNQEEHFYDSTTLFYRFLTGSASSQDLASHSC